MQPPHGRRGLVDLLSGGHDVGASFKALYELRNMLRLIGKIRLHDNQSIATSIPRATRDLANEFVYRCAVSLAAVTSQDREWDDV
jgi:hypothetical protein